MKDILVKEKIRVVLADDIELICRSLTAVLRQDPDIEVLGFAHNGQDLILLCEKEKPHVAIVDIQMPVMNGIDAVRWLKSNMPQVKALILTTFDHDHYIKELISVGIDGYILKACENEALIHAVKSVYVGINTLAPTVLTKLSGMLNETTSDECPNNGNLTETEQRVAKLICEYYYNKDIARELNITYGRVRNIVSSIYKKLGLTDRDLIREYVFQTHD